VHIRVNVTVSAKSTAGACARTETCVRAFYTGAIGSGGDRVGRAPVIYGILGEKLGIDCATLSAMTAGDMPTGSCSCSALALAPYLSRTTDTEFSEVKGYSHVTGLGETQRFAGDARGRGDEPFGCPAGRRAVESPQRTIVVMCDGLGLEYYDRSPMPTLKAWAAKGVHARARGVMPSVTNCNNASICCGLWPSAHGVIGNSYFDEATGTEEYMEDAKLLLAPTIFERAGMRGVRSALLSSKKKTISLLNKGTDIVLTAEAPNGNWEARLGKAPPIY
jgi:hypothetical protein